MRNEEISYEQVLKYCEQRNLVLIDYEFLIRLYNNKKAIPVEWIKEWYKKALSKSGFMGDEMVSVEDLLEDWEKENENK